MSTFLLADDSHDKLILMQRMLHRAGWDGETLIAMTTEQAVALIDLHPIDFAFIDYYFPSENGPTVIAHLKKTHPKSRSALVSSADNQENVQEARDAGAEACICTSYQSDEVERAFEDILEQWLK